MMSDDILETASGLMDGEISANDADVIKKISTDDELKQKWQRYHLVRDSLNGNLPEQINVNLHEEISTSIASEPTILAPKPKQTPAYIKPVAGLAIAASVTVAVLLGVQNFQNTNSPVNNIDTIAQQSFNNTLSPTPQFASFSNETTQIETVERQQAEERLNRYLMNYNELKAHGSVRGMPPYVRMIGYEAE